MKLGLCYAGFNENAKNFEKIKNMGYEYVEIPLFIFVEQPKDTVSEYLKKVHAAGLTVEATNVFFSGKDPLTGPNINLNANVEYAKNALHKASETGVKISVLGSGGARRYPDGFDHLEAQKQFDELCAALNEVAVQNGITIDRKSVV